LVYLIQVKSMLSATFKYIQTGTTVTFTNQVDIDSMKGHPEYERVEDTLETTPQVTPEVKKAGRPKKTEAATAEVQ
jgi:hypothetical protein